jgi:uncharacterized protein YqjF (DUF2071 family)
MKIMELGHYHQLFVNYHVAAEDLKPLLPPGVEMDLFEGRPVVSWVASTLQDVKGVIFPWKLKEQAFALNLRTYVKQTQGSEPVRGFLNLEQWMSGFYVRKLHQILGLGNYEKLELTRSVHFEPYEKSSRGIFQYQWNIKGTESQILKLRTIGSPEPAMSGYIEYFTSEKQVQFSYQKSEIKLQSYEHTPWFLWECDEVVLPQEWPSQKFAQWSLKSPASVFVVKGSKVFLGTKKAG